uniref:Putative acyl-coenzyme A thioesterase 13-like n=1 Tax=Solanum chacoense TaxID=4108 RepID=A0A0V0H8U5_SOLCH
MGEENSKRKSTSYTKDTIISEELSKEDAALVDILFMHVLQDGYNIPPQYHDVKDFFSQLIRSCLKLHSIHPGKISCILSVKPAILNAYRTLHGGAIGAVAERVSIACARTVVGKYKELFLGELRMSYLSAAPCNAEVVIDGSIIRSGRNITVVAVDFRLKDSRKLVYTSNATFYHMPVASL